MAIIAPIIKMDRMIIEIVLIILNCGRVETLRFFLLDFVVKTGVHEMKQEIPVFKQTINKLRRELRQLGWLPDGQGNTFNKR